MYTINVQCFLWKIVNCMHSSVHWTMLFSAEYYSIHLVVYSPSNSHGLLIASCMTWHFHFIEDCHADVKFVRQASIHFYSLTESKCAPPTALKSRMKRRHRPMYSYRRVRVFIGNRSVTPYFNQNCRPTYSCCDVDGVAVGKSRGIFDPNFSSRMAPQNLPEGAAYINCADRLSQRFTACCKCSDWLLQLSWPPESRFDKVDCWWALLLSLRPRTRVYFFNVYYNRGRPDWTL